MADFNINVAIDPRNAQRGARVVQRQLNNIDDSGQAVTNTMQGLTRALGALGAGFVATNLDIFRSQIILLSDAAGVSVQEFQKVSAAFQSVNINGDETSNILRDINDRVGDFIRTGGGEFVDIWEKILEPMGMTREELRKLSAPQILQAVADGMQELGFNVQDTTFFLESLASESSKLSPLLKNNGEELKKFSEELENRGLVVTPEEEEALRRFNAQISDLSATIENVFVKAMGIAAVHIDLLINSLQALVIMFSVQLTRVAIPAAISAMVRLNAIILANPFVAIAAAIVVVISLLTGFADHILISSDTLTTLQDIGIATFEAIGSFASSMLNTLNEAISSAFGFFSDNFGFIAKIADEFFNEIDFSISGFVLAWARAQDSVIGFWIGAGRAIVIAWQEIPNKILSIFSGMFNNLSRLFTGWLNSTIQAINALSSKIGGPLLDEIKAFELPVVAASTNIGSSMARAIVDGIKGSSAIEDTLRGIKNRADQIASKRIISSPVVPGEIPTKGLKEFNSLLATGRIATDNFSISQRDLKISLLDTQTTMEAGFERAILKTQKNMEDFATQTENLVTNAFDSMGDALAGFVTTGKLDFKSLADSIISGLAKIAIQRAIIGPLASAFGFSDGGIVHAAAGGLISGPGGPRDDLIPARLSDGEFVVNANATKRFQPLLEAINSGQVGIPKNSPLPPPARNNRSSTGSQKDVTVQVFDQRTSKESVPVETTERTGTDGRRTIQIMIRDTVKREIDNGLLDSTMQSRFGVRRRTTARG